MKTFYFKPIAYLLGLTALPCITEAQTSITYSYTGAMESFTVPPCVNSLTLDVMGSKGGDCIYNQPGTKPDDLGGLGGRVVAVYPVTPGQVLNIFVGGISYNGGGTGGGSIAQAGGGGASDIRIGGITLADRVVVAGGGGGGGNNCSANPEPGGAGGGLTGATGWQCGNQTGTSVGQGGTPSAGGAAGTSPATAGSLGQGGNAGGLGTASGGGGGGYYGGGGAAYGGGGGGSSYTHPSATSVVHTQGYQNGTGLVTITYGSQLVSVNSATLCPGNSVILTADNGTGATYSWSNGANTATISVSPTVTTSYTVTATSACSVTSSAVSTVTVTSNPVLSLASSTAICSGGTATLTATGTAVNSYSWNTGSTSASIAVSPTVTTTYTVTGTGICGTTSAVSTVSLLTSPTVSVASSAPTICVNNSAVLGAGGSAVTSYTWSTGATTASISVSPTTTTVYTVTVGNACGTTSTSITQYVTLCTSIPELLSSGLRIYPNPASDLVYISFPSGFSSGNIRIEMTDAVGRLIIKEVLTKEETILKLDRVEQGIYFYKVLSDGHLIQSGRILKQ